MFYEKFLQSVFGSHYKNHLSLLYSIHLYCLFVVTLVVLICAYTSFNQLRDCENTFIDKVKTLRLKYAAGTERLQDD